MLRIKMIEQKQYRVLLVIGICFYKILMDIIYTIWVSPFYGYMGMSARFDLGRFIFVNIIFLLLLPFIVKHCNPRKPSDYILLIWDFMYLIPGVTYTAFKECTVGYVLYYFIFYFLIIIVNELIQKPKISFRVDRKIALFIILTLFLSGGLMTLRYNGLHIKFDFDNIYEIRKVYVGNARSYNIIFRYLKNPLANITPIAVYYCLKEKRWFVATLFVILQLMLFSMGASKINFVFLLISIAAAFITLDEKMIVLGFIGLVCVAFIISPFLSNPMIGITDKLVRRMMITPNQLSMEYYNFFSENEIVWFRTSALKFLGNPYDTSTSYVIGKYLGTNNNANNGLAGDAFANCGLWALAIYPLLYGVVLVAFNIAAQRIDKGIVILSALITAVIYIDSNYFTSFLTHGILLILFLLMIYPYKETYLGNGTYIRQEKNCI